MSLLTDTDFVEMLALPVLEVAVVPVRPCWICREPATHGNECAKCCSTSIAIDVAYDRSER